MDFSIDGPHASRIGHKLRCLHLAPSGEMRRMELYGPENLACWLRCYKVLKCTLIMLGEVQPSALDMYADHITELVHRFGDECWGLIYQEDVRCRRELMFRLRRKGEAEKELNPAHPFDVSKLWRWVWTASVKNTRGISPATLLGGDAPVAAA
eukprot:4955290-Amphidinium_carterae.2